MNRNKKSFLLHIDSLDILDELTDEQAGLLFKAIKAYQKGEEIELNAFVRIAFSPFKNQFTRDNEKYDTTCKRRAEAGRLGGEANASKSKQKVANASKCKQTVANVADSVSKNKNKTKSDSDNKSKELTAKADIDFSSFGMTDDQISEVKRIRRKNKGGSITQRVANALAKEFHQAATLGYSFDELLTEWEVRGWKSFKSEWIKPRAGMAQNHSATTDQNINNIGEWLNE